MGRRPSESRINRIIAGHKSQSAGSAFESAFEVICIQNGFSCIRIPNGCRQIGRDNRGRPNLIRIKSPFDYFIANKGFAVMLDVKCTEQNRFTFSMLNQDQVTTLHNARKDCVSGYLVHFVTLNKIVFFDSIQLHNVKPRESIGPDDGLILGTFGYQCDLHKLKSIAAV